MEASIYDIELLATEQVLIIAGDLVINQIIGPCIRSSIEQTSIPHGTPASRYFAQQVKTATGMVVELLTGESQDFLKMETLRVRQDLARLSCVAAKKDASVG